MIEPWMRGLFLVAGLAGIWLSGLGWPRCATVAAHVAGFAAVGGIIAG
jgi:hypothetical protein